LQLAAAALAGHSFGALLAAEIAAATPKGVRKLVLIDPIGLWRDDHPVKNWMVLSDKVRRAALFADPDGEAARRFFEVPSDPEARVDTLAQFNWALACTGKFVWPIADRGFKNRIHRVGAPTLILWGNADGIIAPIYAQEFAKGISGARIELIDKAAHLPHLEQSETVLEAVRRFLI
jgi:pimeloyl-ACP methyl ester carboxylesterase